MNKTSKLWSRMARIYGLAMLLVFSATLSAQTAPSLGVAGGFAILGGSTVTNTGATTIVGDVGVFPGSSITGFPPGSVTGTIHINDAVAQQAQSDLTTAYNNLAGQAFNTDLTGQDLGGLTLTPSVYRFSTSAQLTGTLTLNAQGNPNAVFIFQIGSTLTTASNARVQVINGGSDCNVYFQVGSSATLGTGTQFAGNILALHSITATTGSSVSGRLLTRNGAATLDTDNAALCTAACNTITLAPVTLPPATVNLVFNQTISASGGTAPYGFTLSNGTLPPGLGLSPGGASSVVLSGTPTTPGSYTFTIRATDANGCMGSRVYTIVVSPQACPTILLSPATLPTGNIGVLYSQNLVASGGTPPYTFSLSNGTLPPGLTLNSSGPSNALLSGTPTTPGSYTFTVAVTDASGCFGSRVYTIVINAVACPLILLSPTTLPPAVTGTLYSQSLFASGGTSPYTFSVTAGNLPPGLSLLPNGAASANISGTPTSAGTYTFTITATDALGCSVALVYTVTVNIPACPIITMTPAILPVALIGIPYSQTMTASGGSAPYTFALSGGQLPAGLALSSASPTTALLSGTPTISGNYAFSIQVADANNCLTNVSYSNVQVAAGALRVPALGGWSLLLLTGLFAMIGGFAMRRFGA